MQHATFLRSNFRRTPATRRTCRMCRTLVGLSPYFDRTLASRWFFAPSVNSGGVLVVIAEMIEVMITTTTTTIVVNLCRSS